MSASISLHDVLIANQQIRPEAVMTPLVFSMMLSNKAQRNVYLKLESSQPTGSFKVRGAANSIKSRLADCQLGGVVCASTGNHGKAVAYVAKKNGVRATVCMPITTPRHKIEAIRALGAEVHLFGETQDEAQQEVERIVFSQRAIEVPPFDSPLTIAGQGTVALEIIQQLPTVRQVVCPLSGGGLASGCGIVLKAVSSDIRLVGATLETNSAMAESLKAGRPVSVPESVTLASALSGGIGLENKYTFSLCQKFLDSVECVPESEIQLAILLLIDSHRQLAEGGGAIGIGALFQLAPAEGDVVIVVTGNSISKEELIQVLGSD